MIEAELGRLRDKKGYSSRIIDIDILFYDNQIIDEPSLIIPHPHLHERKFVLVPLNEIASGFIHPVFNKSVGELLLSCKDNSAVIPYQSI
jgi:2-amino-4-hydroxy-6-hydroxymethyldihydropteridine diphosphokinase